MTDTVPVHLVKYDDEQNVEIDEAGEYTTVTNHDELDKTDVIRGMERETAEEYDMDIVEQESIIWDDEMATIEQGEEVELADIRS